MHFHTPPNSTRGSTPDYEVKDELRQRTANLSHRLEQDSSPAVDSTTPSRSASRSMRNSMKRARSRSLDSTSDSSDDGITEPITPPPILPQLSRFVKRAKTDPKPYQRDVADALDSLFLENQLYPDNSVSQVVLPETCLSMYIRILLIDHFHTRSMSSLSMTCNNCLLRPWLKLSSRCTLRLNSGVYVLWQELTKSMQQPNA